MNEIKTVKVEDIKKEAEAIKCPVERSFYYMNGFLSGPMCGKCFPCSMGSYEARILLKNIMEGTADEDALKRIRRIADDMLVASMCKKGKDTAKFILEWLDEGVFRKHIEGLCPERTCRAFIEYRIIAEKCTMCGDCHKACKYGAIHGEKAVAFRSGYQPFEIRQGICTRCGECIKVCPAGAIILTDAKSREAVGV
ncbi:MAG: 4Fe-4S binding protein [Nitrospirota bacterium]|nr:4Fe-4S binding protein [Nitrospirota bacterium]